MQSFVWEHQEHIPLLHALELGYLLPQFLCGHVEGLGDLDSPTTGEDCFASGVAEVSFKGKSSEIKELR